MNGPDGGRPRRARLKLFAGDARTEPKLVPFDPSVKVLDLESLGPLHVEIEVSDDGVDWVRTGEIDLRPGERYVSRVFR